MSADDYITTEKELKNRLASEIAYTDTKLLWMIPVMALELVNKEKDKRDGQESH